mmetsp:Transcript_14980/g.37091  ORF Transcript_14980/g.37091 Transcript_14980/m.37091 type:complete len:562 (+) Transcript_14980:25-1710(+)
MCGIFGVLGSGLSLEELKVVVERCAKKLTHRGPDDFRTFVSPDGWCALGFTRLAIMDPEHGEQPMVNAAGTVVSMTNGELYNHEELRLEELGAATLRSHSDCEVVAPLYEKYASGPHGEHKLPALRHVFNLLRGVFASVTVDLESGTFVAARDPIGIRAMFLGRSDDGAIWFASEAKALMEHCSHVEPFRPGNLFFGSRSDMGGAKYIPYYAPIFYEHDWQPIAPCDLQRLHDTFKLSVRRRLMSDVPLGVFISGGLDSSLVASIAKKELPPGYVFHSFACGLEGSPDIAAAQKVADYLGTTHHVLTFTVEEGIAALKDIIYHLETYDVTTIRASTPMYLLSGLCKQHVKVVLSGEGADEIFGGYLYFHNAPNPLELHRETVRRVQMLYTADVCRGDRATAAQSLELRVPFLDRDFLDVAMSVDPAEKMTKKGKIEKWIMRQAFAEEFCGKEYLPDAILWRQKEQFSDGVGYNWIDGLKIHCEKSISDKELEEAAAVFDYDPPKTKEAYFYRRIFEERFGSSAAVQGLREGVHPWIPKWSDSTDPSGRAQRSHVAAYANGA